MGLAALPQPNAFQRPVAPKALRDGRYIPRICLGLLRQSAQRTRCDNGPLSQWRRRPTGVDGALHFLSPSGAGMRWALSTIAAERRPPSPLSAVHAPRFGTRKTPLPSTILVIVWHVMARLGSCATRKRHHQIHPRRGLIEPMPQSDATSNLPPQTRSTFTKSSRKSRPIRYRKSRSLRAFFD
jgi:hypothetical protein